MDSSFDDLRSDLATGRERLLAAISGVSEEQFKRRPAAGNDTANWSIAEILSHLLYSERLWGTGIALALTQDGVKVQAGALEAREEDARRGRMAPVPQLVHGLLASRRQVELLLDQAEALDSGLQRYVQHPDAGRLTVEWLVRAKVIAGEAEYVRRIEALRDEMGIATPAGAAP
jgi:uncharacterized damage-inducible protein DinB